MKTTELSFVSADGETTIHGWLRQPDQVAAGRQQPRAVIQLIHGVAEHSGRYERVARYFVDNGFAVCAHDQLGHGLSAATPEDLGHMPLEGGQLDLIEDVHELRRLVRPRYIESVPYVMLGHSMGSYVLRLYLVEHGVGVAAAVLSGTSQPGWLSTELGLKLARSIARREGERGHSELLHRLGLGSVGRKMKNRRTAQDWLSTDPEVVDAYIADPFCGFELTNGGYATLLHLMSNMINNMAFRLAPQQVNVFIVSGAKDPLISGEGTLKAISTKYRANRVQSANYMLYPDMRHEVLNEPGSRQVLSDILDWLELRLGV